MELYNLVKDYFDDGESILEHAEEIREIEVLLRREEIFYQLAYAVPSALVGIEFVVDTSSWQVTEANANGHYKVEKLVEDSDRRYYVKNLDTGAVYISTVEVLSYLISHEGHQDYKFVYVGWCGKYRTLG